MKIALIFFGILFYIIGYIMSYKAMKKDAIENFGLEWTQGTRLFALFCSLCSWLTYLNAKWDSNKPAKW